MPAIDNEVIKALAKTLRWRLTDLIVLSEDNDPFFCGRPAHRALGEWFAGLWSRFELGKGVHLRRVHYVLISQREPVLLPNGEPYLNTYACWNTLTQASKPARYLGLVPFDAFVDRRNPDPHIFAPSGSDDYSRVGIQPFTAGGNVGDVWMPSMPKLELPSYALTGWARQRYHAEVWVEKSTMNDVLVPLCQRHGVNLVTGLGEMSIPAVRDLIRRIARIGKEARVLYLSDFDPGGESMPRAVARKAEWLIAHEGLDIDLRLRPIVLTPEQIARFDLPRTPIKETERRKAKFEDRHGEGATELDALEALHPGALADIVRSEILRYHDDTLQRRISAAKTSLWLELHPIEDEVHAGYAEAISDLEDEYKAIVVQLGAWKCRADQVLKAVEEDLRDRMPQLERVELPQPAIADEPPALFDSKRSYAEQLFAYKRYGNGTHGQKSDDDGIVEGAQIDMLREACHAMGLEKEAENGGDGTDPADDDDPDEWLGDDEE